MDPRDGQALARALPDSEAGMTTTDRWAEVARRMKLERVREFGATDSDMVDLPCATLVVRGGDAVACIYGQGPNGARAGADWAALMFAPDEVISLSDTVYRVEKEEKPFKQGDIARAWHTGHREGVTEAILAVRITPLEALAIMFPYERTGRSLRWLAWDGPSSEVEGAVVDYARDGFGKAQDAVQGLEEAFELALGAGEPVPGAAAALHRAIASMISKQEAIGAVVLYEPLSFWEDGEEMPHP